jgi:hypothetical protein
MSDKKPNVFPNKNQDDKNVKPDVSFDYEKEKLEIAKTIYSESSEYTKFDAVDEMRKRSEKQLQDIANGVKPVAFNDNKQVKEKVEIVRQELKPIIEKQEIKLDKVSYMNELNTTPQFDAPFDIIKLPSEGKLRKNKKPTVKMAYMTAEDEEILTSPNLLESGEFLEVLFNRKMLDTDIRYKDLHIGDRNALMVWLRSTSYGTDYPVVLLDENSEPFEAVLDLSQLKTKQLSIDPDADGLFSYHLKLTNVDIKFKLLNIGEMEEIDSMVEKDKENGVILNKSTTYLLEKSIVEVNGNTDSNFIKDFVKKIRIQDVSDLKDYIESVQSGLNLNIEVGTPGGGSIKTFLPLNIRFFWPKFGL